MLKVHTAIHGINSRLFIMDSPKLPKVVILGAGFGGLTAARALEKYTEVTLVDRHNFQTFLPLLYQVSTAGLAADHVAYPIRGALRRKNIKFRMASPLSINHRDKNVTLDSGENLDFDHLIIALGSETNDFGIKGVKEHTLGMKSVHEALIIRSEVMRCFENLCRFNDTTRCAIVVIGGGPTGVEMAGALAELKRGPLTSDFSSAAGNIDIYLLEAGSRLLPPFSPSLSKRAEKDLIKLGVQVLCSAVVEEVESGKILLKGGREIPADIAIWTAGVKGESSMEKLSLPIENNRLAVEQTLEIKDHPAIWAIGDISGAKNSHGRYLPMMAPVAMQQGRFIAEQIKRASRGEALSDFAYIDKGSMATIGRHRAIVEVKGLRISGFIAWQFWLWLHLFYLLGGRNKIATLIDWIWNYLTYDRGNRHIMDTH